MPVTRRQSSLATAEGDYEVVESNEAWVNQTSDILERFLIMLGQGVTAWHEFLEDMHRMTHQADKETATKIEETFWDIADQVNAMEKTLERLRSLEIRIENFKKKVRSRHCNFRK